MILTGVWNPKMFKQIILIWIRIGIGEDVENRDVTITDYIKQNYEESPPFILSRKSTVQ